MTDAPRFKPDNSRVTDWEAQHLASYICPWSGEPLTDHGDGAPGNLSCVLCDCFGYKPEEVGKK